MNTVSAPHLANVGGTGSRLGDVGGGTPTAPSITGTPVTTGTHSMAYTGFTASAHNFQGPPEFIVSAGPLPPGITLNSISGAVAGTFTAATGTYPGIILSAVDTDGQVVSLASFQIVVS